MSVGWPGPTVSDVEEIEEDANVILEDIIASVPPPMTPLPSSGQSLLVARDSLRLREEQEQGQGRRRRRRQSQVSFYQSFFYFFGHLLHFIT